MAAWADGLRALRIIRSVPYAGADRIRFDGFACASQPDWHPNGIKPDITPLKVRIK
ncbi:hypothetical protein GCM10011517_20310 [Actibacterium pelagium]|uniref:Uncharacterized protein n=1 Tax=Actibacterium pelagium TaxID=2029103 RepID=A0A917ELK4_9RHOB|nr:hypothetical protein GCM10011517_20310 [Actibacterium pelagium]